MKTTQQFFNIVKDLDKKYKQLRAMKAIKLNEVKNAPEGGIYMFIKNGKTLYVGRTKRKINVRLKNHFNNALDCPFAFRIARKETGFLKTEYRNFTRKKLHSIPKFKKAYKIAKEDIKKMEVKYISEKEPTKQALLEIYVSYREESPFNDFNTH